MLVRGESGGVLLQCFRYRRRRNVAEKIVVEMPTITAMPGLNEFIICGGGGGGGGG